MSQPYPPKPRGRPRYGPYARRKPVTVALPLFILALGMAMALALFAGIMSVYASYTEGLPDIETIEDLELPEGSSVESSDGHQLATFAAEDRQIIGFEELPQVVIDAVVAAEDQTFWTNPCVDFRSIVRAFLQNFEAGETVSGASTICQQLVRNRLFDADLMADPDRQFERKIKEAVLALRLDDRYAGEEGKQQVLEMYLNQVYFGNNAYGIWAAANAYFGKDITADTPENQLTISEAALLAGLIRSPSHLDPTPVAVEQADAEGNTVRIVPPDAPAIEVRSFVLEQMRESGDISQAEYDAALDEEVVLAPPRDNRYRAPHFVYAVRREAAELLGSDDRLDRDGLTVITTLDYSGYQVSAEKWAQVGYDLDRLTDDELAAKYGEAALGWMVNLRDRNINNDAIVTLNYRTGAVLAYVGSANYYGEATESHQPNYDVVGQAFRQSGSAFKPITYSTGFETGAITPATLFMDVEGIIVDDYTVPNADDRERGPVRARDALKFSLNIPTAKAQQLIGTDRVVDMGEALGLEWDPSQDPHVASLTLGTIGVHQLDLAGAYGALANGGVLAPPYLIERIEDSEGNVVYDHQTDADEPQRVIGEEAAYLVTDILADNTDPAQNALYGPRFALQTETGRMPATLKTGTTNDFRDLQAFGYLAADADPAVADGAIVTGVWVGNSDFSEIREVFAADAPTFIWHDYMLEVAAKNGLPIRDFVQPTGVVPVTVDAMSGMLPGDHTLTTLTELFRSDRQPTGQDTTHVELRIEAETGKVWHEGCGDFVTASPSEEPDPEAPAPSPVPEEEVYLYLKDAEEDHATWDEANEAWLDTWRGREDEIPREPFASVLDAPLAPAEDCTPGEIPTSTPTPSPTPTPTPTPVPTPTPAPTPTPVPTVTPTPIIEPPPPPQP